MSRLTSAVKTDDPTWLAMPEQVEAALSRWAAEHPKRYAAASFAVGTIDQALLGALQVRHAHLRAACLVRHLLVIDEVHASDAYMTALVERLRSEAVARAVGRLSDSMTRASDALVSLLDSPTEHVKLSAARSILDLGLIAAIRGYAQRHLPAAGVSPRFEIDEREVRLPPEVETALFRVTQEALTNVVKHAEASIVRLGFALREQSVVLTIEDDGRGFSRAQVPDGGFGLVGMRERIASLNGALDIESERGAGTRLTIEIPLA